MPLFTSPIDGSPMRQIQRFGIELDICPTSGGIWLDKGELEKLIALMKEAAEEEKMHFSRDRHDDRYEEQRYREEGYHKPRYKDHDDYRYKGKYKKKGAMNQLMEIFDF